jgi:hypothetical protein
MQSNFRNISKKGTIFWLFSFLYKNIKVSYENDDFLQISLAFPYYFTLKVFEKRKCLAIVKICGTDF